MPELSAAVTSFPMTRARVDQKRKIGLANAVAQGRLMYKVGIMPESELEAIRRLVHTDEGAYDKYRLQDEERRREASKARTNLWPDTVQAKQEAFLRRRRNEEAEEQQRKNMLIELGKQQEEEDRRQKQAQLALKILKDDPRGRNVRSLTMLHEAVKEREAQIAFKNDLKMKEEEEIRRERELLDQGQGELLIKEQKDKYERRARNVEEKNEHLQQMLYQIEERKQLRKAKKEGLEEVQRAAEEEARENNEAEIENRQKIAVMHEYNRSIAKPVVSKHDRLRKRIQLEEGDEAARALQEEKIESMKRAALARVQQKKQYVEKCQEQSSLAFAAENARMQHKQRTQDVFETRGVSMLQRLAENEEEQRRRRLEERRQLAMELAEREEKGEAFDPLPEGVHRAAAHRTGFMNNEEEKKYQQEMRQHPALVEAERRAEVERRRAEAQRMDQIRKLQAEEKRESERRAAAAAHEARQRQEQAINEDDDRYRAYVVSQLPADMPSQLREKAMQLHC